MSGDHPFHGPACGFVALQAVANLTEILVKEGYLAGTLTAPAPL